MSKNIYLSYILDKKTPTYGNRNRFNIYKKSNIEKGDIANDSFVETTVHIGTHIDMPYHFYEKGQTIEDFEADFFFFRKILFVELKPNNIIIKNELLKILENVEYKNLYEIIIVKTGICYERDKEIFWEKNYGFHPEIGNYITKNFPKVRVFGFDSISVSSFTNRMLGRESHRVFLNPDRPVLLLEDMDLRNINKNTIIKKIIISPLRIKKCDGLPCTVIGEIE